MKKKSQVRCSVRRAGASLLCVVTVWLIAGSAHVAGGDRATELPIRIGVSLSLTGMYAELGTMQEKAYRLWERQVNERGGILGRPVSILVRNDKSDAAAAAALYEDFIQKDKVDFIFGPYSSSITAAVAPIADKYGYPMLAAGAAGEDIWKHGYQNVFGMWSPAGRYTTGFLAILSEAGIDHIAIVSADDVFSLGVAEGAKKWAPQYGLHITAYIVEPKDHPDLKRAAETARQSGAHVLLLAGHFTEAVRMRETLKAIGWSPTAYYAAVGPTLQKYLEQLGADADGTFSTSVWEARTDLRYPGSTEFLKEFLKSYGVPPSYHAATAYAAGHILQQAILKAGTLDRATVRKTLFTLDTNSIIGRFAVDRTGLQVKQFPMIVQWQGTKRQIVWPQEMRTAKPVLNKSVGSADPRAAAPAAISAAKSLKETAAPAPIAAY